MVVTRKLSGERGEGEGKKLLDRFQRKKGANELILNFAHFYD